MKNYEEHFVAFLDILGFKNIINTSDFMEVRHIFSSIISGNDAVTALYRAVVPRATDTKSQELHRYNESLLKTKIYIMSDSIVIATPCLNPESLAVLVDICHVIQEQLYELETPILIRGAIARGNFYMGDGNGVDDGGNVNASPRNTLAFGKGLVDAYLAQENYAIYPRIILSKDVMEGCRVSIDTDAPLPREEEDGYSYLDILGRYLIREETEDWAVEDPADFYEKQFEESGRYKKIAKLIQDNLSGYKDAGVRKKYIWLEKELHRIKRCYLGVHGVHSAADMFMVVTK